MTLERVLWAVGVLLVLLVIVVCLVPQVDLPDAPLNDKWHHLIAYAALSGYFAGLLPRRHWWRLFLCLLALGISIEFAQSTMGLGRHGDVRDVAANALGVMSGLIAARFGVARWPEIPRQILNARRPG